MDFQDFRSQVVESVRNGARLSALFGLPEGALVAVLSEREITVLRTRVGDSYPSLTPDCPPAHWFEREIAEQWAVRPEGHPWLHPIRFHPSYRPGRDAWGRAPEEIRVGCRDFYPVRGEEVHEVAVGPVHAGVIEPGHFRFQCFGEHVFHLEISLGYQHRGVEPSLVGGPDRRTIHTMETLAGDTSVGHATAYCQALETLSRTTVPPRAQAIRAVALELERLANHVGDLGALANDVAYLPTASYCGRIRGEFLNLTALLCGNRLGRRLVRPGGVACDLDQPQALVARLRAAMTDAEVAVDLLWKSRSVTARFEETGAVSFPVARDLGLVGPAARASGLSVDVRRDHPSGAYVGLSVPVHTLTTGDVYARARVRWLEMQTSARLIETLVERLPSGALLEPPGDLAPDSTAVSLVEGWRGEICHVAQTGPDGRFRAYKVVDPSFHNWMGLAMALRGQEISDFPLCNKSFNLSYCGHDL
ncbi:MAG: NADH-quinone oxidoreductase subunit C [Candidatus Eremiobacterota bacterium]